MAIEEAGPPAPKVIRLLYFVGAGFICTFAINKWREIERKAMLKQRQQHLQEGELLPRKSANAVHKTME